jgi:pimeloyl-ACP methyl ester carboxylesterase
MPHVFETVTVAAGMLGLGKGTPVVMLHASLSCKSQWDTLAATLAARYQPIAVDLVGYGTNALPPPAPAFTIDDEVRLVEATIRPAIGLRRFHLVGHSYGALVALRLAQRQPSRVASLSVYEPAAFRALPDDDPAHASLRALSERVQRHIAAGRYQDAALAFVDYWNGAGYFTGLPAPTRHALAKRVAKVVLDFQASLRWPGHAWELRNIQSPTLVLVGNQGQAVTRRIADAIADVIRQCTLRTCDAGHLGPIATPALVNPCIESFIDACEQETERLAFAAASAD